MDSKPLSSTGGGPEFEVDLLWFRQDVYMDVVKPIYEPKFAPGTSVALGGPLNGDVLKQIPYNTSYAWIWEDFRPYSDFYGGDVNGIGQPVDSTVS